jgi:translation initiation factor 2 subunit 2
MNFDNLVDKAYNELGNKKPKQKLVIPENIVEIESTRLYWKNVEDFLLLTNRCAEHFMKWLKSELPSQEINWLSNSKSDGLIIHGKKQNKTIINNFVFKYINKFVICSSCKSYNTLLTKNQNQYEFNCNDCKTFYFS